MGGCHLPGDSKWQLLQLAVEKPWSAPGGPFFSFPLASFPGPAQPSVLLLQKSGESLVSFLTWAWCNRKMTKICRTNRLHFTYCSTDYTLNAIYCYYSRAYFFWKAHRYQWRLDKLHTSEMVTIARCCQWRVQPLSPAVSRGNDS